MNQQKVTTMEKTTTTRTTITGIDNAQTVVQSILMGINSNAFEITITNYDSDGDVVYFGSIREAGDKYNVRVNGQDTYYCFYDDALDAYLDNFGDGFYVSGTTGNHAFFRVREGQTFEVEINY